MEILVTVLRDTLPLRLVTDKKSFSVHVAWVAQDGIPFGNWCVPHWWHPGYLQHWKGIPRRKAYDSMWTWLTARQTPMHPVHMALHAA